MNSQSQMPLMVEGVISEPVWSSLSRPEQAECIHIIVLAREEISNSIAASSFCGISIIFRDILSPAGSSRQ